MLDAIKNFFNERVGLGGRDGQDEEHRLRLATAALLIEVSRADSDQDPLELEAIHRAIGKTYGLADDETEALIEAAKQEASESTSYYQFTSLINSSFSAEEKVRVVEMMWRVAFVDGELDKYEEALVRRVADLIHVPHRDFIASKLKVQEELTGTGGADIPAR